MPSGDTQIIKNIFALLGLISVFIGGYFAYLHSIQPSSQTQVVQEAKPEGIVEWTDSTKKQDSEEDSSGIDEALEAKGQDEIKKEEGKSSEDSSEKVDQVSETRPFKQVEDYPGYNMEVMEEKKVQFLVNELGLFPKDAQKVSERYQDILKNANEAKEKSGEREMMEVLSEMSAEYDIWLREKLGDEDFKKYNDFVAQTFAKWQTLKEGQSSE